MLNRPSPYLPDEKTLRMERTIKRLCPGLWDSEIENRTWAGRLGVRAAIDGRLDAFRRLANPTGEPHYAYCLNTHKALAEARAWIDTELARLTGLRSAAE